MFKETLVRLCIVISLSGMLVGNSGCSSFLQWRFERAEKQAVKEMREREAARFKASGMTPEEWANRPMVSTQTDEQGRRFRTTVYKDGRVVKERID